MFGNLSPPVIECQVNSYSLQLYSSILGVFISAVLRSEPAEAEARAQLIEDDEPMPVVHEGCMCDGCRAASIWKPGIPGTRYKCLTCAGTVSCIVTYTYL